VAGRQQAGSKEVRQHNQSKDILNAWFKGKSTHALGLKQQQVTLQNSSQWKQQMKRQAGTAQVGPANSTQDSKQHAGNGSQTATGHPVHQRRLIKQVKAAGQAQLDSGGMT
jgi:hypothetical protein